MSEQAMSKEALLQSLVDIELPSHAAGGWIAELLAVVALAAFAALVFGGVLRLFSRKRTAIAPSEKDRLASILALPEQDRRLALLYWLRAKDPERYQAVASTLYRPNAGPELSVLEAEAAAYV